MSQFNIGAEFEFATTKERTEIELSLSGRGITVLPSQKLANGNKDYSRWFFVHDGSIKPPYGYHPFELVSPVMTLNDGIEKIKTVFKYLIDSQAITNESTGFHVNLSFADPSNLQKIDVLKCEINIVNPINFI